MFFFRYLLLDIATSIKPIIHTTKNNIDQLIFPDNTNV